MNLIQVMFQIHQITTFLTNRLCEFVYGGEVGVGYPNPLWIPCDKAYRFHKFNTTQSINPEKQSNTLLTSVGWVIYRSLIKSTKVKLHSKSKTQITETTRKLQ